MIAITGILASLTFTAATAMLLRAETPACIANLKTIHLALSNYLIDNQQWPQLPKGMELNSPQEDAWWRTTLAPYGTVEKSWSCRTLLRTAREKNMEAALRENHYVPSLFDESALTPHRWSKIPWVMEVGNNHGTGLLVIMMDGSAKPYEESHSSAQ